MKGGTAPDAPCRQRLKVAKSCILTVRARSVKLSSLLGRGHPLSLIPSTFRKISSMPLAAEIFARGICYPITEGVCLHDGK